MGFFLVMKAELVRNWITMRRYWVRTLVGMTLSYGMLMVLIVGFYSEGGSDIARGLAGNDAESATNFVLGFIIGMFAFGIIGMYTQGLQAMASTGVLEQLCMSPHGLITNFLARTIVGSVTTILSSAVLVYAVARSVGGDLYFFPIETVVLLTLTFANLLGFGLLVGGLVLIFKQVGQIALIVRMVLFGLAIFAKEELVSGGGPVALLLHLLPITDASICLKYVLIKGQMSDGVFHSVFAYAPFYWLLVSCVLWNAIGVATFKSMESYSRLKGTLGTY